MKKLSERNQLKGKKGLRHPMTESTSAFGSLLRLQFTNEAVADLNLKTGDEAWAVIKASDVMIGV